MLSEQMMHQIQTGHQDC